MSDAGSIADRIASGFHNSDGVIGRDKLAHPLLGNFETDGEHALIERTRGRAIVVD